MHKVTSLVNNRTGIWTYVCSDLSSVFFPQLKIAENYRYFKYLLLYYDFFKGFHSRLQIIAGAWCWMNDKIKFKKCALPPFYINVVILMWNYNAVMQWAGNMVRVGRAGVRWVEDLQRQILFLHFSLVFTLLCYHNALRMDDYWGE